MYSFKLYFESLEVSLGIESLLLMLLTYDAILFNSYYLGACGLILGTFKSRLILAICGCNEFGCSF
jgi:hypothetical protein